MGFPVPSVVMKTKKPPTMMTLQRQLSAHTKQLFDLTLEVKSHQRSINVLQMLNEEFRRLTRRVDNITNNKEVPPQPAGPSDDSIQNVAATNNDADEASDSAAADKPAVNEFTEEIKAAAKAAADNVVTAATAAANEAAAAASKSAREAADAAAYAALSAAAAEDSATAAAECVDAADEAVDDADIAAIHTKDFVEGLRQVFSTHKPTRELPPQPAGPLPLHAPIANDYDDTSHHDDTSKLDYADPVDVYEKTIGTLTDRPISDTIFRFVRHVDSDDDSQACAGREHICSKMQHIANDYRFLRCVDSDEDSQHRYGTEYVMSKLDAAISGFEQYDFNQDFKDHDLDDDTDFECNFSYTFGDDSPDDDGSGFHVSDDEY